MSWFKRRPRIKEQPKQTPQHSSPLTERLLEEQKQSVRPKHKKNTKDKNA